MPYPVPFVLFIFLMLQLFAELFWYLCPDVCSIFSPVDCLVGFSEGAFFLTFSC
uniref:Uncharacterized protein n=1 Tax=Rhizophora mucronata TaxID=61149 RepID=A0A2P2NKR4_RHIMU